MRPHTFSIDTNTNRLYGTGTQYDPRGNLTLYGGSQYAYDGLSRQTSYIVTGSVDERYLYDAAGERVAMVVPGNTTVTGGYFYPIAPCRLFDSRGTSIPAGGQRTVLAWNACGIPATATALAANVTSVNIPGNGYLRAYPAGLSSPPLAWVNAFRYNQPTATQAFISINGPTPGSFTLYGDFASGAVDAIVDVDGYVGAQSVSTPDTYTLNLRDPQNRLATKYSLASGVSSVLADYVYVGNQLVAKCPPSGGCSFFVTDHLGTPRLQTDTNATTVTKMKTRAFGLNLTGTLPDASDFASMEKDASSGNHYDHARYYMSWVARFHSPDQLGGHPADPQSWNRYAYALNSPLRYVDPTGLANCQIIDMKVQCGDSAVVTAPDPAFERFKLWVFESDTRFASQSVGASSSGALGGFAPAASPTTSAIAGGDEGGDPFEMSPLDDALASLNIPGLDAASNYSAGYGDWVSFGLTKYARPDNVVDTTSGAYKAGTATGVVWDVATLGAAGARAAGWQTRLMIHGPHHPFGALGKLAHIQLNAWRLGVKGSGRTLFRIPLPWR